jgi:hypothetical protein
MKYVAWLVVAVPLGWGLMKSVQKSVPLFSSPPAEVQKAQP